METSRPLLIVVITTALIGLLSTSYADDAKELAEKLSAARTDGNSDVRMRLSLLDAAGAPKTVLQLQVKSRQTQKGADVIYQILWPKERKGEAALLKYHGGRFSGASIQSSGDTAQLGENDRGQLLFDMDLSYADVVEDFYAWSVQESVGNETIDGVECTILQSKPGKTNTSYSSVKSWVDSKRLVPLRVEKLDASGKLVRRIDTTRVVKDDNGKFIAATLLVRRPGQNTQTEIEGTKIRRDVQFTDTDFTAEAIKSSFK